LGRRRVFVTGMVVFGFASLACGAAPTVETLVAFRALKGVGAALLVPSSLAIIQSTFVKEDRGQAIGIWSGVSGLATIIGPFLGGFLTDAVSWRLIFLINPPIIAFAVWATLRHVPETRRRTRSPLDVAGAIYIAVTLGAFAFVLVEGGRIGWSSPLAIACLIVGTLALVAFLYVQVKGRHPMMPLSLFRNLQFSGVNLATLFIYFSLSGAAFLVVLQFLGGLGYGSLQAGAALAPVTLLLFVMSPWAGRLATRIGPRIPMTVGPIIAGVGMAMMTAIAPGTAYVTTALPALTIFGMGLGLTVAPPHRRRARSTRRGPRRHRLGSQQRRGPHRRAVGRRPAALPRRNRRHRVPDPSGLRGGLPASHVDRSRLPRHRRRRVVANRPPTVGRVAACSVRRAGAVSLQAARS
jgi:EmrB/QacA subfamily drug resistance transporter